MAPCSARKRVQCGVGANNNCRYGRDCASMGQDLHSSDQSVGRLEQSQLMETAESRCCIVAASPCDSVTYTDTHTAIPTLRPGRSVRRSAHPFAGPLARLLKQLEGAGDGEGGVRRRRTGHGAAPASQRRHEAADAAAGRGGGGGASSGT
jgi:hypothetical protein